jgi:hypothetical protein
MKLPAPPNTTNLFLYLAITYENLGHGLGLFKICAFAKLD